MPEEMFVNPIWHALKTRQSQFVRDAGIACKYETDVAPFAAVGSRNEEASEALRSLLKAHEIVYSMGEPPVEVQGLKVPGMVAGLQMVFPGDAEIAVTGHAAEVEILELSCADAADMVELTTIAFPGYFRIRTCEMGTYYGVRVDGRLVSMAGERFKFDRYVEISGVCTHPEHTGKGYAAVLITRLLEDHRRDGWLSCLHLSAANQRALDLYKRLGFEVNREVSFHKVVRS